HSLDVGYSKTHFAGGFGRVFFSFFAGVGLYRLQRVWPCPLKLSPWLLLFACFWLLIAWPHRGVERTDYDLACALILFPVLGYLSTAVEPGPAGQRLFVLCGGLSYALYLLHSPIGGVLNQFFIVFGRPKGTWFLGVLFILAVSVIAWLAERYYDAPVRRWLNGLGKAKPKAISAEPARAR
ncbi:MAG TPA: acyltransferase family protein, partial [Caulobacteraceae bacterium]|nr:acyltransferase family protein [Caulobacteraceae bacterium]